MLHGKKRWLTWMFMYHDGIEIWISRSGINDTVSSYTSINIPANSNYKHIALRFTTVGLHQAVKLDNFKWEADATPPIPSCEAVSAINQSFDNFSDFPDSCWTTSQGYPTFIWMIRMQINSLLFIP